MGNRAMKKRFTEEGVDRLRLPDEDRVEYGDTNMAGLMLRVTSAGVKSWSVLYKVKGEGGISPITGRPRKGTQRRLTLGTYPAMGVKEARARAAKVLQQAMDGKDTRVELVEATTARTANSFEAIARQFIEQDAKPNIASWSKIERSFELHVFPKWEMRPIGELRRRDVHELLDGLAEKGALGTARDVRKHLSRLFNWAVDREIVTESPMTGLKRKDLHYDAEAAGRALTDIELKAIWRAAEATNYPFGPFFQLMILTG